MLDNLRFDDESPIKFEHILEKDKYWICINCNKVIHLNYNNFFDRKSMWMRFTVNHAKYSDH